MKSITTPKRDDKEKLGAFIRKLRDLSFIMEVTLGRIEIASLGVCFRGLFPAFPS